MSAGAIAGAADAVANRLVGDTEQCRGVWNDAARSGLDRRYLQPLIKDVRQVVAELTAAMGTLDAARRLSAG